MAREDLTPWPRLHRAKITPGDTGSEESLNTVAVWLKNCWENHIHCKSAERPLPKRVIDLGGFEQGSIRLLETNGKKARYICLSYCWGSSTFLTTTTTSLDDRKRKIELSCCPTTIRDALYVAHRLGIRYMWIDSLCILQDSEEDWIKESASMANIYEGSYVTIVAAKAADVSDGCFTSVSPDYRTHKIFLRSLSGLSRHSVYVRREYIHGHSSHGEWFPLLRRGWALQERLLSRRKIYFGPQELSWECNELTACECSGFYEPKFEAWPTDCLKPDTCLWENCKNSGEMQQRWCFLVSAFSFLKLTKPSDRLPAIQGIAENMLPLRKGRYLCGLWEDNLIYSLAWTIIKNQRADSRPTQWRSPSWSWASVDGGVVWFIISMKGILTRFYQKRQASRGCWAS
jgi:hypothetical protein